MPPISSSLAAHFTLAKAHWICHLYRWGDRPDGALDRAWAVVERMTAINSQDERTLTVRGLVRVNRGEYDGGLADLRRAYQINPNYAAAIIVLAFAEATTGLAREAEAHAKIALRLSPRDYYIGTAHLALAMAHFTLRNYDEAVRWCESAIQVSHRAPIRRALMIACSARAGDMARAGAEIAVLDSFAPGFIASVFRVRIQYSRARRTWSTFWTASASRDFVTDRRHRAFLLPTSVVGTELTIRNVRSSVANGG